MIRDVAPGLAEELTRKLLEVEGVVGVYPSSAPATAVAALVTAATDPVRGRVRVSGSGSPIRISARLATVRSVGSRSVVDRVAAVVEDAIGAQPYELRIEIASVD